MSSGNVERYRVVRSATFYADWDNGVVAGWLNPMVHPAQLEFFTNGMLATVPLAGEPVAGAPANILAIRFPRSVQGPDTIEITYSVIEDDRIVTLEHIQLLS